MCAEQRAARFSCAIFPPSFTARPSNMMTMSQPANGIVPMAELEKQTILNALAQVNGDKMLAARLLGIGKTTLYRKLKEYESQN